MATAIGAAFERAGIRREDVEFEKAIAFALNRYINSGGTNARASALLMEAAAKLAGGATEGLPNGLTCAAPSSHPNCEAKTRLPQGHVDYASQSEGDERGQHSSASNGLSCDAPLSPPDREQAGHIRNGAQPNLALPPVREPSAAQTRADIAVTKVIALTAFDRELTHTGRRWGNVTYRELDSMREDGDIASEIKAHIGSLRGDPRNKQ